MKQHIIQTIETLEKDIAEIAEAIESSMVLYKQKMNENPDSVSFEEDNEGFMARHELRIIMRELQEAHQTLFRYYQ